MSTFDFRIKNKSNGSVIFPLLRPEIRGPYAGITDFFNRNDIEIKIIVGLGYWTIGEDRRGPELYDELNRDAEKAFRFINKNFSSQSFYLVRARSQDPISLPGSGHAIIVESEEYDTSKFRLPEHIQDGIIEIYREKTPRYDHMNVEAGPNICGNFYDIGQRKIDWFLSAGKEVSVMFVHRDHKITVNDYLIPSNTPNQPV